MQIHSNLLLHIQQASFYPAILTNLEITPVAVIWTAAESTVYNQHYFVLIKWQWSGWIASCWAPWSGPNSSTPAPHTYLTIHFSPMLHQLTLKSGYNIKIQYATLPALHANSTNIPIHLIQRHITTKCQWTKFWFLNLQSVLHTSSIWCTYLNFEILNKPCS
jgi:hypothetical protein